MHERSRTIGVMKPIAPILKRIGLGLAALAFASAIWLPVVHLFFKRPVTEFRAASGISPMAAALAARHLKLWADPALREIELRRMRGSNAEWDFMSGRWRMSGCAIPAGRQLVWRPWTGLLTRRSPSKGTAACITS
jgi:hypothetical protein